MPGSAPGPDDRLSSIYFFVNTYLKPREFYWPLVSFWWSFHGGLWVDHVLMPLAGVWCWPRCWPGGANGAAKLLLDPAFGASILAVAGCIFFMTIQNHPQPRYFTVVAFFSSYHGGAGDRRAASERRVGARAQARLPRARLAGWAVLAIAIPTAAINGYWTLNWAVHPEYTFVSAAGRLTQLYGCASQRQAAAGVDQRRRITLVTHVPALCDDFGTEPIPACRQTRRLSAGLVCRVERPGPWHARRSASRLIRWSRWPSFPAFDDPERNVLVLFKLHPLAGGKVRDAMAEGIAGCAPGDSFEVAVE